MAKLSQRIEWGSERAGRDTSKTVGGTSGPDFLFGTDGDDTLTGLGGNDELFGRSGNDALTGDQGADKLYGEAGNDTLTGGTGDIRIDGGAGTDHAVLDFGSTSQDLGLWLSNTQVKDVSVAGTTLRGIERITFTAGSGDDGITGGAGNDVIRGGAGDDYLSGGQYTSISNGVDVLDGGSGFDHASVLLYTATQSFNFAVNPNATVTLANGTQLKSIEEVNFAAGSGHDTLTGGAHNDHFNGGGGHDTLTGLGGTDALYGAEGNDTLTGGTGANSLHGGAGVDTLIGGTGQDVFVFRKGEAGGDQVLDLAGNGLGAGDTLRFENFGSSAYLTHQGNQWTIHDGSHTESISLNVPSLTVDDYVFA